MIFLAVFEYNGTPYAGWQAQPGLKTIQGEIEAALKTLCCAPIRVQACGRTDAGVHALAMPVSFAADGIDANRLREGLNGLLAREPLACLDVYTMPEGFNARFDCLGRAYEYRILDRRAPPALTRGQVHALKVPLDVAAMNEAAGFLIGHHDFSTFRSSECQALSPMKTLDHLAVSRRGEEVVVTAHAKSFLHHQVRLMVGSLLMVGKGNWTPKDMKAALRVADLRAAGPMAPSKGLYFVEGLYEALPEPGPYFRNAASRLR